MGRYRHYTHPVTRSKVRSRKRGMGDIGMDLSVAQKGISASVSAVKSVGVVALIAAGGAIATDYIFNTLLMKDGKSILGLTASSTEENIAKAVAGIAGGIVIGKFLKKPQLGAAFAIGAVALAAYKILNKELKITTAGLGYVGVERAKAFYPRPMSLGMGAQRVEMPGFQPQVAPAMAGYGSY